MGIQLVCGQLSGGFRLPSDGLVVVTDEEIFGQRRRTARRRRVSRARAMSALGELTPGDFMVHVDHGIGVYRGLKHIAAGGTESDFIHLEYAGGDRYYLPVDRINLVERYMGSGNASPTLDKLGGTANFLYSDGHVERKTIRQTLETWEWGRRYYSISGYNKVGPPWK